MRRSSSPVPPYRPRQGEPDPGTPIWIAYDAAPRIDPMRDLTGDIMTLPDHRRQEAV